MSTTTQDPFVRMLVDDLNDQIQSHMAQAHTHRLRVDAIDAAKSAWLTASPRQYVFDFEIPDYGKSIRSIAYSVTISADSLPQDTFAQALRLAIMDFLLYLKQRNPRAITFLKDRIEPGIGKEGHMVTFVLDEENSIKIALDYADWAGIMTVVLDEYF